MNKGQNLYKKAKKLIPGGNMLLSKRPEMFLPELWPSYFSKSNGCNVWDLDGKQFVDMSIMGIGTNILGYGNNAVDSAVLKTVKNGNMSTLNCPEEVMLAEKLVSMNPWSDMVRFARSGGEANAIAVRIARAASGKDKVAICGYHGWHDWYLSVNLETKNGLEKHLLKGLDTSGVPKSLQGSTIPFNYNDFEGLKNIISKNDIGTIKMEVQRNEPPQDNFLQKVRDLATDKGIVLIFDECTSGFRETFGGLHAKYKVNPDIVMYGKALGNGYAITAVVGTKEVMEAAQSSFISSTFWTERIGPSAALASLEEMERLSAWEVISRKGRAIRNRWKDLSNSYDINIDLFGLDALSAFSFNHPDNLKYKTFLTQEMLKKGFLASNSVYVCTEHTDDLINDYFEALEDIFSKLRSCKNGSADINSLLDGPVCHSGFSRLN